ncbi:endospore germination permease [Paenibacillus alginolyticus]|uniref:Endospore germination permease n=1 Tax=Paenibacillus alginolyticus TaxID=59839 RepID=A0ABT4GBD9_9BACL|nr:endospore germination permease [Paenibacillus alginolyticus]MCY9666155.1 endospore germination permease [Paenibacillus alginolyticus]MCY9693444.1 endospore germination permease [Paenibacillus alginolyticus]MEC0146039.1 endospore germination permease [Paenibacillus alginolyticus]
MLLDKGKISAFQLGLMMYPTVLATGLLALPTITAQYAKNDLWLTSIFASILGFISVYIATRLHELYPKMTVIQYSERILGKIPGKLVGFVFFVFTLHSTGIISRQYADFVKGNFLFKSPILLVISSIILLTAFAVRGGVEILARSAVIFTPIFILPIFILLVLIPDMDVKNIFPILSHGIIPVIKGSAAPMGWVSEFFIMTFFLPYLADPEKGGKWGFISLSAITLSMIYVNLLILFLLGPDVGNKTYPVFVAFRYISVGNIFENMEALLLAMWVVGNFIKIGVFYYAAVLSFGQWLNLSEYRPYVFPLGIFIVALSMWDLPSFTRLAFFITYFDTFYLLSVLLLIPLLLLIVALLRKGKSIGEGDNQPF